MTLAKPMPKAQNPAARQQMVMYLFFRAAVVFLFLGTTDGFAGSSGLRS